MPIDPSIPLSGQAPKFNDPFAVLGQMRQQQEQSRLARENADSLRDERLAMAEQHRQQTAAVAQAQAESDALSHLFGSGQPVNPPDIYKIVGPTRGAAILKGMLDVQTAQFKNEDDIRASMLRRISGIKALPEDMRAGAYGMVVNDYVTKGVVKPDEVPPYSPQVLDQYEQQLLSPDKRYDAQHPKPIEHDTTKDLIDPSGKVLIAGKPKDPKPASAQEFEYRNSLSPEQRAAYDKYQNEDANRRRSITNVNAGAGKESLDQDGIDFTATQYRLLGPGGIPTRIEGNDKVRIINAAAAQAKALGQSPVQAIQRQAARKSDGAALTQMTKMKSSAEAFEEKAVAQADIIRGLSAKVSRTNYPIINDALLAGKARIAGDADTQLLFNALTTFTSEYAKIVEGSTGSAAGSSDAARRAAAGLISASMSKGTLPQQLDLMQKEMRLTGVGYDTVIDHITERMGGKTPTDLENTGGPAGPPPPKVQRVYYDMNGNQVKR